MKTLLSLVAAGSLSALCSCETSATGPDPDVRRLPWGATETTPRPPQTPSPFSALGAVGLGSLSWRMKEEEVRRAYSFVGNAPGARPMASEWELPHLTSAPYAFGGCEFVVHFGGWEEHPVYWEYRASSLLDVMLIYRGGPRRQCRAAIEKHLTAFLARKPEEYEQRHELSWESSDGKRGYRNVDRLTWRTEDSSVSLDRIDLRIEVMDEVDESPFIVRQLLTVVTVAKP